MRSPIYFDSLPSCSICRSCGFFLCANTGLKSGSFHVRDLWRLNKLPCLQRISVTFPQLQPKTKGFQQWRRMLFFYCPIHRNSTCHIFWFAHCMCISLPTSSLPNMLMRLVYFKLAIFLIASSPILNFLPLLASSLLAVFAVPPTTLDIDPRCIPHFVETILD